MRNEDVESLTRQLESLRIERERINDEEKALIEAIQRASSVFDNDTQNGENTGVDDESEHGETTGVDYEGDDDDQSMQSHATTQSGGEITGVDSMDTESSVHDDSTITSTSD